MANKKERKVAKEEYLSPLATWRPLISNPGISVSECKSPSASDIFGNVRGASIGCYSNVP